jgi:sulfopyruvate decarboxylase TPP-binding subunit
MTTYVVPTSKMGDWLRFEHHIIAADEAEAVAMACGEYLATGQIAKVGLGENGLLKALDAIITLSQLQEIPIDLHLFPRSDEPQHKMVTDKLQELLDLYQIKATIH